jgi:hypothetical protein
MILLVTVLSVDSLALYANFLVVVWAALGVTDGNHEVSVMFFTQWFAATRGKFSAAFITRGNSTRWRGDSFFFL